MTSPSTPPTLGHFPWRHVASHPPHSPCLAALGHSPWRHVASHPPHSPCLVAPRGRYKIHIKVQWRSGEELHVLGEGGRDSGGERSVATMVYLISLQNINPAPFRVVDEINQAMDSTNERHVFECITHACKEGGKQYFLLTPKLLPDLDYGEETAIQLVLNGPYNASREALTLADWA